MTMYSRLSDIELNLFPWNLIKYILSAIVMMKVARIYRLIA